MTVFCPVSPARQQRQQRHVQGHGDLSFPELETKYFETIAIPFQ